MMTAPSFFSGYFNLNEWAEWVKANAGKPINATLYRHPGTSGQYGDRVDKLVIEVSPTWDGAAHYCRIPVGSLAYVNNQPWDADAKQRFARAEGAWQIVADWLREQGFQPRNAQISKPRDLFLVDGHAAFLDYDQEQKADVRR